MPLLASGSRSGCFRPPYFDLRLWMLSGALPLCCAPRRGTSLRLFASGGISGQLGRFTRPFLDYTAVALRADVGLTSQVGPSGWQSCLGCSS